MSGPRVAVVAFTHFLGPPDGCVPSSNQDRGSDMARLIETAGRVCYQSHGKGRGSEAFHQHLQEVEHLSVIEHASLSFYISGISRGCSHELVRHRVGVAISMRSTRYVDESESEWCWHPALDLLDGPERGAGLISLMSEARQLYTAIVARLEPLVGRKQARGAARGVLGNALETALVWTANLRALRHFLELRATDSADAEIRLLANRLYEAAWPFCPEWLDYEQQDTADGIGYCLTRKAPP